MAKKQEWPKLPKRFKNKWLKALRGGEYKQATGALVELDEFSEDGTLLDEPKVRGFCCLGVACMIQGADVKAIKDSTLIYEEVATQIEGIPAPIIGNVEENALVAKLIAMNDGKHKDDGSVTKRKSFKQIATWIEENL